MSMQALSDVYGDGILSSGIWPPRSPDHNPCNFFFCACLKENFYKRNPRKEELKIFVGKLQISLQGSFKG
jgi:hypothetical protein